MIKKRFGVILGSGFDAEKMPIGKVEARVFNVHTPYDVQSTPYDMALSLHGGVRLAELPLGDDASLVYTFRHLEGHALLPSEVNYRGIMYAMKTLGVEAVIGVSAVRSRLRDITPGTLVAVEQYIDRTYGRAKTFYGNGIAARVSLGQPVCQNVRRQLIEAGEALGNEVVSGREVATLMVMEGPATSTQAEAEIGRRQAPLIGTTSMPEAALAREAELCYCTLAGVTEYDSCYPQIPALTASEASRIFNEMREKIGSLVVETAKRFLALENYQCTDRTALDDAIRTNPKNIPHWRIEEQSHLLARWSQKNRLNK